MEFVVVVVIALVVGVIGIVVGMLVAPRMAHWGQPSDPDDKNERPE